MPVLRALLASLLVLAAGIAALARATDGFRAYTSEAARRIAVREHPRSVPDVMLQTAEGREIRFDALRGRWWLVDFIYTRCTTYCSAQGGTFAQLQSALSAPIAAGDAGLLSVSFDPGHDDPARLAGYLQRSGDRGTGWIAARPMSAADLGLLLHAFGVTAVPDGLGGFVHNVAIAVVDPQGRLVDILDWDDPLAAARYVQARVGR